MHRRRLLASLAGMATLSGCSGLVSEGSPTTAETTTVPETTARTTSTAEEPTEETTAEETESDGDDYEWPPGASLVDLETGDLTLALAPTRYRSDDGAEVAVEFTATATPDRPAAVRATLTNAGDAENTFRLAETPPFDDVNEARLRDRTYRSSWYLVPTANHDLADEDPDFRRGPEGYWRLAHQSVSPQLPRTVRLDPGETIEGEYVLLGDAEGEGRPAETYEFRGRGDSSMRITAWETSAPGPDGSSRLAGASPPDLPGETPTTWYHYADEKTPVYLEPSAERGRLPARFDFTIYNHARESLTGNPYDWTLYKLVDGEWLRIAPWGIPQPLGSVPPGGTEDWTLYAFHGEPMRLDSGTRLGHLGGGRYAFEVGMSLGHHSHAALFDVDAPEVTVEPRPGVESSRDGATVTVDVPDPDRDVRAGTLRLTRADAANAADRLVPEQVMRRRLRALRNGLPFFEAGVEEVVVETTRNAARDAVGYDGGPRAFRFEGEAYEARFEGAD